MGRRRRTGFVVIVVIMLLAAVSLGLCVRSIVATRHFLATAVAADGLVVEVEESSDDHGSTYVPVVRFVAAGGQVVRVKGTVGSSQWAYQVGDSVRVLYDPAKPRKARLDTRGNRWGGAIAWSIVGGSFLLLGAAGVAIGRVSRRTRGSKASVRERRDRPRSGPPPSGTEPNRAPRQETAKDRPQDSTNKDRPQDSTNKDE